jgi:subtilisin family serine protease
VYVLDTGIRTTHREFWDEQANKSRAEPGFDAVTAGGDASGDCHGHGTHVAAVVGGNSVAAVKLKNVARHHGDT